MIVPLSIRGFLEALITDTRNAGIEAVRTVGGCRSSLAGPYKAAPTTLNFLYCCVSAELE
jgi:hypothetical protein